MALHLTTEFKLENLGDIEVKTEGGIDFKTADFEGYGAVFANLDRQGDVIEKGAFAGARPTKVKLFWQHKQDEPIGIWKSLREDDHGLYAKGQINLGTQRGMEAYSLLKQGALDSLSVGFRIPPGGQSFEEQADKSYIRRIAKTELFEISLVSIPANPLATITSVKSEFVPTTTEREFEAMLRDQMGLTRAQAKALMVGGWKSLEMRITDLRDAEGDRCETTETQRDAGDGAESKLEEQLLAIRKMSLDLHRSFERLRSVAKG